MTERLSPLETIMWRVGNDAVLRMTVGALIQLDRQPTREAMVQRLAEAAELAPRLALRPNDPTRLRSRPAWVPDEGFDAAQHVRTMAVPSPGGLRDVLDLIGMIESTPFAPDRSPWDVTMIEGLAGGQGGIYLRAHHALTDGLGGLSIVGLLLDETEAPWPAVVAVPEPEPVVVDASADAGADDVTTNGAASPSDRRPGTVTVTFDLPSAVRPVAAGVSAAMHLDPFDALVRGVQRSLDVANSVARQVVVAGGPLSPLPQARSVTSRFEALSVEGARAAALGLGGSRNDLLVAGVAGGLGLYLGRLGLPAPELRLATPSRRPRSGGLGGNWIAPTRVLVPTAFDHPGPHFGVVAERLSQARHEPAVRMVDTLASTISRLPTRVLVPALHAQAASVDFVATALPGFRANARICGGRVLASYPYGPRLGCAVNVTALGNANRLDLGIALDPTAVTNVDLLLECLADAFNRYAPDTATVPSRRDRPSA